VRLKIPVIRRLVARTRRLKIPTMLPIARVREPWSARADAGRGACVRLPAVTTLRTT
jgi:hypothetical protein